jgi:carotenoid cleavage dioxygenase-like enzyme
VFVWKDPGHFVSEPVFVAKPAAEREDVGVVLFTLLSAAKHNSVQVTAWTNLSWQDGTWAEFSSVDSAVFVV